MGSLCPIFPFFNPLVFLSHRKWAVMLAAEQMTSHPRRAMTGGTSSSRGCGWAGPLVPTPRAARPVPGARGWKGSALGRDPGPSLGFQNDGLGLLGHRTPASSPVPCSRKGGWTGSPARLPWHAKGSRASGHLSGRGAPVVGVRLSHQASVRPSSHRSLEFSPRSPHCPISAASQGCWRGRCRAGTLLALACV